MSDIFTINKRRKIMRAIQGRDTRPEQIIRSLLISLGHHNFKTNYKRIPGSPDIAFIKHKRAIFINGCYWHRHACRKGRSLPKTHTSFWQKKFHANKQRDACNKRALKKMAWSVLIIWECQIKKTKIDQLTTRIAKFLSQR